jgi:hypothetical protein
VLEHLGAQVVVETMAAAEEDVGVADDGLGPCVECAGLEAVGDQLDLGLVEPFLLRNCEADVPSVAAVGDARAFRKRAISFAVWSTSP